MHGIQIIHTLQHEINAFFINGYFVCVRMRERWLFFSWNFLHVQNQNKKNTRLSHSNNDFGLITTIYNNLQESNCSFHKYGCFVFCFLFYFLFSTIKLQIYTDKPRLFFFAIIKYGSEFKIKIMHSSADNRWISSLFALDYIVFIGWWMNEKQQHGWRKKKQQPTTSYGKREIGRAETN